jgi:hypothetical protein
MDSKPADPSDTAAGPVTKAPHSGAAQPHRADTIGAGDVGNVLTKFAVVLLSSINAVLWEVYTEAPVMAAVWAAIAVWFVIWIVRDRNR